jgi:hypothetical protein
MKTAVQHTPRIEFLAVTLLMAAFGAAFFFVSFPVRGAIDDCPAGYRFDPRSGVGCVQTDCASVPFAHYSYEGYCVCGSSGSINENLNDPNKECGYPSDRAGCPHCLYACVHLNEDCPSLETVEAEAEPAVVVSNETAEGVVATESVSGEAVINLPTLASLAAEAEVVVPTCTEYCTRLFGGKPGAKILETGGAIPACRCNVDYYDDLNRLVKNVVLAGDQRTTLTFDPTNGDLLSRENMSLEAERSAIRERLGYKYREEEIDRLLESGRVDTWFVARMENIETSTHLYSPAFWWQHAVALLDHGFGNDADFVDTYHYGRCGDSMLWLERELSGELGFSDDPEKKHEAMVSITGEKYWNTINHTSLIIRPQGLENSEWDEMVKKLQEQSGTEAGLSETSLRAIDSRLLDAKVLDPYFRKTTTVKDFIRGWSVIRIS